MVGAQVYRIHGKRSLASLGLGKISMNGRWLIVRLDWGEVSKCDGCYCM
jgi:hypothetical protein